MAHVIATSPLSATSCSPLSRSYSPRVSGGAGFAVDEEGRSSTYVMVNGVSVRSSTARQALWPQRPADRRHFRQARPWADGQRRGTAPSSHSPAPKVLADTEVIRKAGSELVSVALVSDVVVAKPNPIGSRRTDREHEDVEYPA